MVSRAYFFHFCGSKIAVLKLWSSVPVDLILFAFLKMLIFESNNFKKSENFGPSFITSIISHSSFLSRHSSVLIPLLTFPIPHYPFSIDHSPFPTPHSPFSTLLSPLPILHSPVSIPRFPHSITQSPILIHAFSIIPFKLGISLPWRNFENPKWSSNFCVNWVRMIRGLARIISKRGKNRKCTFSITWAGCMYESNHCCTSCC